MYQTGAATNGATSSAVAQANAAYPVTDGKLVGPGVVALAFIAGALFVL